jgi:hypothetical protein
MIMNWNVIKKKKKKKLITIILFLHLDQGVKVMVTMP